MLAVDKLRALFQRAGMSAAESNAAVRNTTVIERLGWDKSAPHQVLGGAFVWAWSPEGHEYWADVHARLSGMHARLSGVPA